MKMTFKKEKKVWNKKDEIIKMYVSDNIPTTKIADKFNCSYELIRRILHENFIPIKTRGFFFKNKTYEEIYGKEKAQEQKEKISNNAKYNSNYSMKGKHHTEEAKRKIGEKSRLIKHSLESIRKAVETRINNGSYKHKESTKIKIGYAHKGEKSYNWKGGITSEAHKRVKNREWIRIAEKIRIRDNNTCKICFKEGVVKKLPIHHIIPFNISKCNENYNLITLCQKCHMKFENKIKEIGYKQLQSLLAEKYGYQYSQTGEVILKLEENKL